jgi:antitoxin (DNA-binding transcriptional repressor) of toxin-antitoxin stability system
LDTTISVQEAQARLIDIVAGLRPGQSLVITQDNQAVAQLLALDRPKPQARFGSCKGSLTIRHEDDEHLADFKEYM